MVHPTALALPTVTTVAHVTSISTLQSVPTVMTTGWVRRVAIPASTEPPTRTGLSVTAHTRATMVWAATLSARAMVCVTRMAPGSATVTPW